MNLLSRMWNMVSFATIGPVTDTGGAQTAQLSISTGEVISNAPVIGFYGLASNPPVGSQAFVIHQNGDRSKAIVVGTNHQSSRAKNQAPGETSLHNDSGQAVELAKAGINFKAGGKPVTLIDGDLKIPGNNIEMTGDITNTGNISNTGSLSNIGEVSIIGDVAIVGTLRVTGAIIVNGITVVVP